MRYIIPLIILCSCGRPTTPTVNVAVPSTIQPYAAAFESMHGTVTTVQWTFGDLVFPVLAECTLPDRIIEIDQTYWASATDVQREETVTHELGHCILGRAHLNTVDELGNPVSLMNAYILEQTVYTDSRSYYLNELFDVTNVPMLQGISTGVVYEN